MFELISALLTLISPTPYDIQKTQETQEIARPSISQDRPRDDRRVGYADAIKKRFEKYGSTLSLNADTFADTAIALDLDWTLLPAISMVESTGCKHFIRSTNNCFGWGSGTIIFDSHDDAISKIGMALSKSRTYQNFQNSKTIEAFAKTYNPSNWQDYTRKINYFRLKFQNELDID